MGILEEALKLAERAHEKQIRTGGAPYIEHPKAVAEMVRFLGDVEVEAAALLHDVLEDGDPKENWKRLILQAVGPRVLQLVIELTTPTQGDPKKKIQYGLDLAKRMSPEAKIIKIADRLHNLRSCRSTWKVKSQKRYARGTQDLLGALLPLPVESTALSLYLRDEVDDILRSSED